MKGYFSMILFFLFVSCHNNMNMKKLRMDQGLEMEKAYLIILGTVQDAGSPHIACKKDCCRKLFSNPDSNRKVVSLGLIDSEHHKKYLIEATPDIAVQMKNLYDQFNSSTIEIPDGVFLTHTHIGHYTGLMYFGKEAMNADKLNVYAMPRMKTFLEQNGPWSQLVNYQNINIHPFTNQEEVRLTPNISIKPILVPHRDEYSETVAYLITGPSKKILFIPDIDKWSKWNLDIIQMITMVDFAFIDGTFYDGNELKNRSMAEIPHPFIVESMELFKHLSHVEKSKIYFIHLNHTNPALIKTSQQSNTIIKNGFNVARMGQIIKL